MDFTRERIIRQARLHHVLASMSLMYFQTDAGRWDDSAEGGSYVYYNGMGDHISIAWDDRALVALAFSDESEFAEYYLAEDERDPWGGLGDRPGAFTELGDRAAGAVERLASSGLWCEGDTCAMSQPMDTNWADGLEMLAGFGLAPDEALYSGPLTQPWSQLFSLAPGQCEVAVSWIEALADQESVAVSEADEEVLLTQPMDFVSLTVESVKSCAEHLAQMGIEWDVPVDELAGELRA
jgi:hypothetical protein